jgi:SAM-dependent methyltransferase
MSQSAGNPRWTDIAADPMDPRVIAQRRSVVDAARRAPVPDRAAYLCALAQGKRVLDVGVVDHTSASERSERWLHGRLAAVAGEILGVDIVAEEVEVLRERGYNVVCLDITGGELPDGPFDLIVAGELIEHLGSPASLFDAAAQLLTEHGRLVLSTPNPYAAWRVYQNMSGRTSDNVDHALLLNAWGIAELAERAGLRLDSFRGISAPPVGWKAKLFNRALGLRVLPFVPESVCESVLYDIVRNDVAA